MHKKLVYTIGSIANIFECYEFSVYAYLAGTIAIQFFPQGNMQTNLIKVFLLFAVSYFIKPLGGIFWGYIGDYYSRATVMRWSLVAMALPTFLIALLPTYAHIGTLSTVLLLILRLCQGFAMGGELPGSVCYLYEISEKKDQRFHCSLVSASSMLGMFLGASLVTFLHLILTPEQMQSWGWRVPFLLGLLLAGFIYIFRNQIIQQQNNINPSPNLTTTTDINTQPANSTVTHSKTTHLKILFNHYLRSLFTVISINSFIVVSYYLLFLWMPTYMIFYLKIPESTARLSTSINLICLIILTLLLGRFSIRYSQKFMLLLSLSLMAIIIAPLFYLLSHYSSATYLIYLAQFLFAIAIALAKSVGMETMTSLFERKTRCLGMSLGFSLSLTIFGSLSPSTAGYLIHKLNNPMAPIILIFTVIIFALPFVIELKNNH